MRSSPLATGLAAGITLGSLAAGATPITVGFAGDVVDATGPFAGAGSTVHGSYTIDDGLIDSYPGDSEADFFHAQTNPGIPWSISISIGSLSFSTANNVNAPGTDHHWLQQFSGTGGDSWILRALRVEPGDDNFVLILDDNDLEHPLGGGPGGLDDTPVVFPGDASTWDTLQAWYSVYDSNGDRAGTVQFDVTALFIVPEPSTALLVAGGLIALGVRRRGRATRMGGA